MFEPGTLLAQDLILIGRHQLLISVGKLKIYFKFSKAGGNISTGATVELLYSF